MAETIDQVKGRIVDYDERTGEVIIRAPYSDIPTMIRREYKEVIIQMVDSRPLSEKQRRSCYAMISEISKWAGYDRSETKELLKTKFWTEELWQTVDTMFSLSNAPMSTVAAFQSWLARFIVSNDIPTNKPMLSYVDDVGNYIYSCLSNKRCCICGKKADLHHVDHVGMGRDRTEIIHLGMNVLPLCREHHTEVHTIGQWSFNEKYHLNGGIELDKALCRIYGLKTKKEPKRKEVSENA